VSLAGGAKIPAELKLLVVRQLATDVMRVSVASNGSFIVDGLPTETITLICGLKGYRLSGESTGFDGSAPNQVRIAVAEDVDRIALHLVPLVKK
jgi:hypothetical protein